MPVEHATPGELDALRATIEAWAEECRQTNPLVAAIDRDPEIDRWYVRMLGEEKSFITVWLTLRQRTLHFESYFMPAPEEHVAECFEYLLRANPRLYAWRFSIGAEDAVYIVGQLALGAIDDDELDRIIGSAYAYSEQYFPSAMSIGYASKYRRQTAG